MIKVLLALEKYTELVYIETLLKKVGFDCQGCQNEIAVPEFVLSFVPDMVIANATGKKINGLKISARLKKSQNAARMLLLAPDINSITDADCIAYGVSAVVPSPIDPKTFISAVARVLKIDEDVLFKKFERAFLEEGEQILRIKSAAEAPEYQRGDKKKVVAAARPKETMSHKKILRYKKALEELPVPKQNGLKRDLVTEQVRDFRKSEGDPEIEAIDEERQEFVRALFKKV